jgi:hypothetical protein
MNNVVPIQNIIKNKKMITMIMGKIKDIIIQIIMDITEQKLNIKK